MRCPSGSRIFGEHISLRRLVSMLGMILKAITELLPSLAVLVGPTEPNPPIFFGAAAALLPPTCPKPRRPIPMPNRSSSLSVRGLPWAVPYPALPGLTGVGDAILG